MSTVVLAGTVKGGFLIRSKPDRSGWSVAGPVFKGWKVTAAERLSDGSTLIATASDVYGPSIHRSQDLEVWQQIENGPRYAEGSGRTLTQIWRIQEAGDVVYAGVDEAGLFTSADGGESWRPVAGLNDHATRSGWFPGAGGLCAHSILVDSRDPRRVWCGISAVGVFRSEDGGVTWESRNAGIPHVIEDEQYEEIGFCVHALVADPDDANRIWRQDHTGMFRTTDGGDTWTRIQEGLPSRFGFPIARDRQGTLFAVPLESDEYRLPVGGRLRVYASTDDGDSWSERASGLPDDFHAGVLRSALAVDRADPAGVYFGTTAGTVHTSRDGGASWETIPVTLPRVLTVVAFEEA